jgi:hypothetical protein
MVCSSTKPSMEGLYPVLIVMCSLFYCIVSQEHQIPVERCSQCMNGMIWVSKILSVLVNSVCKLSV